MSDSGTAHPIRLYRSQMTVVPILRAVSALLRLPPSVTPRVKTNGKTKDRNKTLGHDVLELSDSVILSKDKDRENSIFSVVIRYAGIWHETS